MIFAEAVTLAHVARPIALSRILRDLGHDVCIAAAPSADRWLEGEDVSRERIESIDSQRFLRALARGSPPYDTATFIRYVEDDLRAIRAWRPDIVIGDFRLSLYISARLAGKPYGAIANAYWSRRFWPGVDAPAVPPLTWLTRALADRLFRAIRPGAFAVHAWPFHRACHRFGVPSPGLDLRDVYTTSDVTAFADVEAFYEVSASATHEPAVERGHYRFVGPLSWQPGGQDELPLSKSGDPIVFVALGSSGQPRVFHNVLSALSDLPVRCLVATGNDFEPAALPRNTIFHAPFVPYASACSLASLLVCNGGAPACYEGIAHQCPIAGIPGNLDQLLNMRVVERLQVGRAERPQARHLVWTRTIGTLLQSERVRASLRSAQKSLETSSPALARIRGWIEALPAASAVEPVYISPAAERTMVK